MLRTDQELVREMLKKLRRDARGIVVLEHGAPRAMRLLPREGGLVGVREGPEVYELGPGSYRMSCLKGTATFQLQKMGAQGPKRGARAA